MQKRKILVVDDEAVVLSVAAATLRRAGYETVTATNGKDALALCEEMKGELGLVISDIRMPGMDGLNKLRGFVRKSTGAANVHGL